MFLVITFALFACSEQNTRNSFKLQVNDLKKLLAVPSVTPPINSAEDAVKYVVHKPSLLKMLQDVQHDAEYTSWNITANVRTKDASHPWEVHIHSVGKIPSFACAFTFTANGEPVSKGWPLNYCRYNK